MTPTPTPNTLTNRQTIAKELMCDVLTADSIIAKSKLQPVHSFHNGRGVVKLYDAPLMQPFMDAWRDARSAREKTRAPGQPAITNIAAMPVNDGKVLGMMLRLTAQLDALSETVAEMRAEATAQNKVLLLAAEKQQKQIATLWDQLGVKS